MARPHDTHAEFWTKFWSKVDKTGPCWLWTGNKNAKGYGRIERRGTGLLAHRVMLFWFGRIPNLDKMRTNKAGITLHSCDNPACVNPAHLSIGTAAQNSADLYARGRMPSKAGERGPLAKLSDRDALDIHIASCVGVSRVSLAEKYAVNRSSVDSVINGKTYKHVAALFGALIRTNQTGV